MKYEEDIVTLKSIVVKQQQALSRIDAGERDCNIIISGLSETDIVIENNSFSTDAEKVTALLGEIETELPNRSEIQRLGKESPNYCRAIKVNVLNKTYRDNISQKAKHLKDAAEPWSRVYLKKDLHPVVVQENSRLRKKKKELQRLDANKKF